MRESTSRPNSSVPNQWTAFGDWSRDGRSIAAGSLGAIHGANMANRTNTLTITMPAIARRLRRPSALAVLQVVVRFIRQDDKPSRPSVPRNYLHNSREVISWLLTSDFSAFSCPAPGDYSSRRTRP